MQIASAQKTKLSAWLKAFSHTVQCEYLMQKCEVLSREYTEAEAPLRPIVDKFSRTSVGQFEVLLETWPLQP